MCDIWYNGFMNEESINIRNNCLTYVRGYVYSIQYHIVWCTKYRKKVLINGIDVRLKAYLKQLAFDYDFKITAMEVMPDHIHILVDCKPQFFPSDMIKILKGNTARWLFRDYPKLKEFLFGGHLWNPSYCIVTVSDRSLEKVENYINSEKER